MNDREREISNLESEIRKYQTLLDSADFTLFRAEGKYGSRGGYNSGLAMDRNVYSETISGLRKKLDSLRSG